MAGRRFSLTRPVRSVLAMFGAGRRKEDAVALAQAAREDAGRGDLAEATERLVEAIGAGLRDSLLRRTLAGIQETIGEAGVYGAFLRTLRGRARDRPVLTEIEFDHRLRTGDFAGVEAEAGRLFATLPAGDEAHEAQRSDYLGYRAHAIARQGRLDEATALLDERLGERPDDAAAREQAAILAYDAGDLQRARTELHHACRLERTRIGAVLKLAVLEAELDNPEALPALLEPFDHVNCLTRGNFRALVCLHLRIGDRRRAAELLRAAIADGSNTGGLEPFLMACEVGPETAAAAASRLLAEDFRLAPDPGAIALLDRIAKCLAEAPEAPASLVAGIADRREALMEAAADAAFLSIWEGNRHRFEEARRAAGLDAFRASQPVFASFVCPIHRPRDVANAAGWIGGQSWTNAEAVFAINSTEISEDAIRAAWRSEIPLRFVDCVGIGTVGGVLNRAIPETRGDVVLRFDADDWYLPDYVLNMLLLKRHFGARVAVKELGKFHYFAGADMLVQLRHRDMPPMAAPWAALGGGSTLCFDREVHAAIPFQTYSSCGEDTVFLRQCVTAGVPVHLLDPFNYVAVRSAAADHTWGIEDDERFFGNRPPHLVGNREAIDRFVRM